MGMADDAHARVAEAGDQLAQAQRIQRLANVVVRANRWMAANPVERWADVLPADLVGDKATWIESMKASREMFTADSLPTREGVMSLLKAFEVTGQVPEATKMNSDALIDTRFVRKALEKHR